MTPPSKPSTFGRSRRSRCGEEEEEEEEEERV